MKDLLVIYQKEANSARLQVKERSDYLMNFFLTGYFFVGLILAFFYDTWIIAVGVGGTCLLAYYSVKILLPASNLYQYVLSAVFGIFMAQYIYQMHGLFEMHFFAFIASALLITYQKWKLQIPAFLVVFLHHAIFSYLQNKGVDKVYFTQLEYFDFQTFLFHILLTTTIFFICGLWAYQLSKYNEIQIAQALKMMQLQKVAQLNIERAKREEVLEERNAILENIDDAYFSLDKDWKLIYWNNAVVKIFEHPGKDLLTLSIWELYPNSEDTLFYYYFHKAVEENAAQHFEIYYEKLDTWFETSVYPSGKGLSIFLKNVSARKIAEIKLEALYKSLQENAKELEASTAELEQFAYSVSHDLQEPLRMVTGFLSIFEQKYAGLVDDKGKQYIQFAVDGAKQMRQVIQDLLAFSRVGKAEDKLDDVNLSQIIEEISGSYKSQPDNKKVIITRKQLPVLKTFKAPVRQVFQNLISNGIKYQKPGNVPEIEIYFDEQERFYQFSVRDNGIGVSKEYHDKIFILFKRLHNREVYDGTGMGLAITKKIIENMGGKIWVESADGTGSTFHFTIPKTPIKLSAAE